MKLSIATKFENSKVRKRFLGQMIPMCLLLNKYGFESTFADAIVGITKQSTKAQFIICLEEGETRYSHLDMIFLVSNPQEKNYTVAANQMRGILRTLVRWGALAQDEIPEHEIEETVEKSHIKCACCCCLQTDYHRLKQCRTCRDRDRTSILPAFKGFYCSAECQRHDWQRHKTEDHHSLTK